MPAIATRAPCVPCRCWTKELAGISADLGAAWIHGLTDNPLVPLASSANVALASKLTNYNSNWLFTSTGAEATTAQEDR